MNGDKSLAVDKGFANLMNEKAKELNLKNKNFGGIILYECPRIRTAINYKLKEKFPPFLKNQN